jgi:hypothetical protein
MQDKHKFKQLGTIYESMVTHDEDEEGDQAMSDRYRTQDEVRSRGGKLDQLKQAQQDALAAVEAAEEAYRKATAAYTAHLRSTGQY